MCLTLQLSLSDCLYPTEVQDQSYQPDVFHEGRERPHDKVTVLQL